MQRIGIGLIGLVAAAAVLMVGASLNSQPPAATRPAQTAPAQQKDVATGSEKSKTPDATRPAEPARDQQEGAAETLWLFPFGWAFHGK